MKLGAMEVENISWEDDKNNQTKDQISLEITQEVHYEQNLISSIQTKLYDISFLTCIFPIPIRLCSQNKEAYIPKLVSIGPFHHNEPHLQSMQTHKWYYLNSLLGRQHGVGSPEITLDSCIQVLKKLEPKIRACYGGKKIDMGNDEFVTMMLLDGCFILELFLRYVIKGVRRREDELFNTIEEFFDIRNDLILLENQIPFFVLQQLFSLVPLPKQCNKTLVELALRFFKILVPGDIQVLNQRFSFEGSRHLLDLIRICYHPVRPRVPSSSTQPCHQSKKSFSVSHLRRKEIKIRKAVADSVMDVKFVGGQVHIPTLKVHNHLESLLRNLIAMEDCCDVKLKHVTSYAYYINGLVESKNDVSFLCEKEILTHCLGKEQEVVLLFKNLCKDVKLEEYYYEGLWNEIMDYISKQSSHRHKIPSFWRSMYKSVCSCTR